MTRLSQQPQITAQADRRKAPEGVLGDGIGLQRGDGLAPFSYAAADADI